MKFTFSKKTNTPKHKKDGRINPHRFMLYFATLLILVITIEIVLFTYFFIISSQKLDTDVVPSIDVTTGQIEKIEENVQKTQEVVSGREGMSAPKSLQ